MLVPDWMSFRHHKHLRAQHLWMQDSRLIPGGSFELIERASMADPICKAVIKANMGLIVESKIRIVFIYNLYSGDKVLPIYLTYLPTYPPTLLPTYLSTYLACLS